MKTFEELARFLAHEVRSPLSTVSFACELLRSQPLDARGEAQLARIRGSVGEIVVLLDGFVEYARATRSGVAEPVDLDRTLAAVLADLGPRLEEAGMDVKADPLPTVVGVPAQLQLALRHLIENVVNHGAARGTTLRIETRESGRDREIHIMDAGGGIDPLDRERIFELFERGEAAGAHPGSGVGLAIARQIAEVHGGRLALAPPAPDEEPGAHFVMTLPAGEPA